MKTIGLVGGQSGKFGNAVFYQRGGQTIGRVYQPVVANPNTARQQLSRAKFTEAIRIARPFLRVANIGFGERIGQGVSAFNEMMRRIIPVDRGVISGTRPDNLEVEYAGISVAEGPYPVPQFGTAASTTPLTVSVSMSGIPDVSGLITGDMHIAPVLVIYSPDRGSVYYQWGTVWSEQPTGDVTLTAVVPQGFQGQEVYIYGFLKGVPVAKNGIATEVNPKRYPAPASNSVYIGSVTVS